ncbi:Crp/Fnr family transcriptional regulator [Alkalicella caledoniensis]|uniref:Crp/Fnr family transcriptional regulator n=1 Tax=Alkalicella caledoniensis TaxID=2731377 RepID=A0A7G9W5G4_ALKCA|nr:Crp/Fnr family transcriptional regulator [Alkalicella caledoniensis]QNO13926.1 Crp/Fnr family transcriptional regulator [Alkalicella caledoniensis]
MDCGCDRCRNKLCASKVPIFANLNDNELLDIIKMTGHREFLKGESIFFEGDSANTLYIINQGKIKLSKFTRDGKQQILHILSDGDFFGELNLLKGGQYNFDADAITKVKLCTITKEQLKDLILTRPEIGLKILEVVGERLAGVESLAQHLATNDVESRIAFLLYELKDRHGKKTPDGTMIELPLTREEMSNYTGVARETISRKLQKMQSDGVVKLEGTRKILVIDEDALEDLI